MNNKDGVTRYLMLYFSIIMLIIYILPHHHHNDGMACYSQETTESLPYHSNGSHTCTCTGHHLYIKSIFIDEENTDTVQSHHFQTIISDLYKVYFQTCIILPSKLLQGIYIEKLRDRLLTACCGLRAPPYFLY